MSGVTTCSRIFVGAMNLAMLLVALTVIALTIWIRCDNDFESEIRRDIQIDTDPEPLHTVKSNIRTGIIVSFWVIIGFAIASVILGAIGIIGSAGQFRVLLILYFIAMAIMIALEIAVGIYVLKKRGDVRSTVKAYVADSYQMNTVDIRAFQDRYNCCGVENQSNVQCLRGLPDCSNAVWNRLDYTMMIFGSTMIPIIVLEILTALFALPLACFRRPSKAGE